jgi:tetratricopeptide (TPR) repeat protein
MKNLFIFLILIIMTSCTHQKVSLPKVQDSMKIEEASWDALSDESYFRWGDTRLQAASNSDVAQCYLGQINQSLTSYKEKFPAKKKDPLYWVHVGNCYYLAQQLHKAEIFYQLALNHSDSNKIKSLVFNNLGLISFQWEKWDIGREYLNKAILADPNAKVPKYNLSQLLIQFGHYDKAIALLNSKQLKLQDVDFYFSLGNAYFFKGDLPAANKYFEKIPKSFFKRSDIAATYALYLIEIGDMKQARLIVDSAKPSAELGDIIKLLNLKAKK